MIKRLFFILLFLVVLLVAVTIGINTYRNMPTTILKKVEEQIASTKKTEFDSCGDWVWAKNRTFIFDVYFFNLFRAGIAKMHIAGETLFNEQKVIVIETTVEPQEFFKKIYDAQMMISAGVSKDSKESLWYRELTITPEKEKSKEIIFDPIKGIAMREGKQYKVPSGVSDPLSVFFAFLSREFIVGEEIVLKLLSKEEIYEFKAVPQEKVDNVYRLTGEVFREDKSSTHGARFSMFIYNDKVRVPLVIKASTGAGPVYLRLRTVE